MLRFRALQRYAALPFASKLPAARVAFSRPAAVCGIAIRQQASGGACCPLLARALLPAT